MKINIMYDVATSFVITVERNELPATYDELLQSVTRDEISDCGMVIHDIEWSNIKKTWRCANLNNTMVYDEKGEDIDFG